MSWPIIKLVIVSLCVCVFFKGVWGALQFISSTQSVLEFSAKERCVKAESMRAKKGKIKWLSPLLSYNEILFPGDTPWVGSS